jgi:hypothetical protein
VQNPASTPVLASAASRDLGRTVAIHRTPVLRGVGDHAAVAYAVASAVAVGAVVRAKIEQHLTMDESERESDGGDAQQVPATHRLEPVHWLEGSATRERVTAASHDGPGDGVRFEGRRPSARYYLRRTESENRRAR